MGHVQRMVRRSLLPFIVFALIPFFGIAQTTDGLYRMKTIVVDAGHGGKDPGNLGTGRYKAQEKDIALEVALRVGSYIEKQFPEIEVIYTRSTDVFIGLNERADIANRAKADLFISIHCNAFSKLTSHGVETFVLGLHRNKENLQVAMKENSAIYMEDDYKTKYEGFDPNSAESIIALTIMQSAFLQQSLSLSTYIQKQFRERVGRVDRGVKQAGFLVLRKTTMPSVLVELGFLTNADEEDFLNSENGKSYMSSAIFRGFKEYKDIVEDPLPDGYVPPEKEERPEEKESKIDAEKAKNDSIEKAVQRAKVQAIADSLEQVKQDMLKEKRKIEEEAKLAEEKMLEEARLKAEADSIAMAELQQLELKKQQELELKQQQARLAKQVAEKQRSEAEADSLAVVKQQQAEEDLSHGLTDDQETSSEELRMKMRAEMLGGVPAVPGETERENQLKLKARADSLELKRQQLLAAKEKREAELAEANEKVIGEQKAKEEKTQEELRRQEKAKQAKEDATEWLEEIKAAKELELAEAKVQVIINSEADNVGNSAPDPLAVQQMIKEQMRIDSLSKAHATSRKEKEDSTASVKAAQPIAVADEREKAHQALDQRIDEEYSVKIDGEKAGQDSVSPVKVVAEELTASLEKARADSIAAAEKAKTEWESITIGSQKAVTPEEAELLFLKLRKRQLEQRIAELTGRKVRSPKPITPKQPEKQIEPSLTIEPTDTSVQSIFLSVQVITSAQQLSMDSPKFKGETVRQYEQSGLYKYVVGSTADFEEITKLQDELRALGFKGAFVVAFQNGERIKVSEARKLMTK